MIQTIKLNQTVLTSIKRLSNEAAGSFIKMVAEYVTEDIVPNTDENDIAVMILFDQIRENLDQQLTVSEKRSQSGAKGGRPTVEVHAPKKKRKEPVKLKQPDIDSLSYEDENYIKFLHWLKDNTPDLIAFFPYMKEKEFHTLKDKFGVKDICETAGDLYNKKKYDGQYKSLYLTLNNWLKRKANETGSSKIQSRTDLDDMDYSTKRL